LKLGTVAQVATRAIEVRIRGALGLRTRPYKALLELTSSCNSRCTTCDIWRNPPSVKKEDLSPSEINTLFSGLGRDLVWLALSGGEVTLVPHFPEVVRAARRHCPNLSLVTFTTNGLLPEKALAYTRCLVDQGFDPFVTVSLDGDEAVHDRIRGVSGNHSLALRTLKLLRDAGIPAHFGITLGDGNREFVKNRYAAHQDDIKAVTFVESGGIYRKENPVDDAGILESLGVVLRSYRVRSPGELVEWIYLRLALAFFRSRRERLPLRCDVLRTSVHVKPNGDVLPCMFLPAVGNLRRASFPEIRESHESAQALKQIDAGNCPRCWMNCYAPHSIMSRPLTALLKAVRA
jgi:MoaA/NifB/PqqE/SkfB family radical SAM enzyme